MLGSIIILRFILIMRALPAAAVLVIMGILKLGHICEQSKMRIARMLHFWKWMIIQLPGGIPILQAGLNLQVIHKYLLASTIQMEVQKKLILIMGTHPMAAAGMEIVPIGA